MPIIVILISWGCSQSRRSNTAEMAEADQPAIEAIEAVKVIEAEEETAEAEKPKVNFHRPENWLMGYFQADLLVRPPHDEWYLTEYNSYKPDVEKVFKIMETNVSQVTVLIVLGTWCPDSHREVPRFMKLIDECGLARIKVSLLGVDMNKIAPIGDYEKLEIKRVPTFIVYRNNIEIGRIIEYPATSLEGDLTEILRKNQ